MSPKCPECGLSNFASATECKRCHTPLASAGYADNVWRDGNALVLSLEGVSLPGRCWKCNSSEKLSKWKLDINFYPLVSYFTILLPVHIVVWTTYSVPAVLCSDHRGIALEGPRNTMFPKLLMIFGFLVLILAVISGFAWMLVALGLLLLVPGLVVYKLMQPAFRIRRRVEPLLWIKGVDPQYLALLPSRK